jgi:hypothetical protein
MIIINVIFFWKYIIISKQTICVKFVGHNFKVSHRRQGCGC